MTMKSAGLQPRVIRILLAAPSLDILGGQSRQAVRLREGLSTEPTLKVDFLAHNPRLPRALRWLQSIKFVRTIATTLYYWLRLLLLAPRYDILHTFSASYYSYLLCAAPVILVAKLFRKKSILNYRSGEADDHLRNWRLTAIPIMRLADAIVVPSGYLVDVFARFGLKAKAIYNLVELDRFQFRERKPIRPIFLTSRLLEPLYNVECVLRAFHLIQERYPEAKLTVAAEGWMKPQLQELARELKLNAEFIGRVPFDQMPAMYNSADIYLTATNLDNMPASITECMAAGLPVVTTDAGGIPYIVTNEETCLMVPKNDFAAMANAAFRLLENNELALSLTRQAREASAKFTWNSVRQEWISFYHDLLKPNVRTAPQAADVIPSRVTSAEREL